MSDAERVVEILKSILDTHGTERAVKLCRDEDICFDCLESIEDCDCPKSEADKEETPPSSSGDDEEETKTISRKRPLEASNSSGPMKLPTESTPSIAESIKADGWAWGNHGRNMSGVNWISLAIKYLVVRDAYDDNATVSHYTPQIGYQNGIVQLLNLDVSQVNIDEDNYEPCEAHKSFDDSSFWKDIPTQADLKTAMALTIIAFYYKTQDIPKNEVFYWLTNDDKLYQCNSPDRISIYCNKTGKKIATTAIEEATDEIDFNPGPFIVTKAQPTLMARLEANPQFIASA